MVGYPAIANAVFRECEEEIKCNWRFGKRKVQMLGIKPNFKAVGKRASPADSILEQRGWE